jgi:Protein of unknown function (DUF3662)/FHA domain
VASGAPTRFRWVPVAAEGRPIASGRMGLQSFERGLERMVDGVFSRAFRSQIQPVELGRRMLREMEDHRTVDVRGRTIVPNAFTIRLNPRDRAGFHEFEEALVRELGAAASEHIANEGYTIVGPITVDLVDDETGRPGRFAIDGRVVEPKATGVLVLPSGERRSLGDRVLSVGRMLDNDIVIEDPNVSRRHAEIRPLGTSFVVADLGSTNGTLVNGGSVRQHVLQPGDTITLGSSSLRFEAS